MKIHASLSMIFECAQKTHCASSGTQLWIHHSRKVTTRPRIKMIATDRITAKIKKNPSMSAAAPAPNRRFSRRPTTIAAIKMSGFVS
jgi:hypothetical protein